MVACACGFLKSKKVAALIMIIRELFEKRTDLSFPSNVIDNASVVWGLVNQWDRTDPSECSYIMDLSVKWNTCSTLDFPI